MAGIYQDHTLYGFYLSHLHLKLFDFTRGKVSFLYTPPDNGTAQSGGDSKVQAGTNLIFNYYLELAFRRVGGSFFTVVACITAAPIGFVLQTIHFLGRYLTKMTFNCPVDTKPGHDLQTIRNTSTKSIIDDIEQFKKLEEIDSIKIFVNLNLNKESSSKNDHVLTDLSRSSISEKLQLSFPPSFNQTITHFEIKWACLIKYLEDGEPCFGKASGTIDHNGQDSNQTKIPSENLQIRIDQILISMDRNVAPQLDNENCFKL